MAIEATIGRIQVDKKTTDKWKLQFKHGDRQAIAQTLNIHKQRIIDAFDGLATPDVIAGINAFYNKSK